MKTSGDVSNTGTRCATDGPRHAADLIGGADARHATDKNDDAAAWPWAAPGVDAAVGTDAVDAGGAVDDVSGDVEDLVASRRAENTAVFDQLRAAASIWTRWRPTVAQLAADRRRGRRDVSLQSMHESSVVTEVALALALTDAAATDRVDAARALLVDARLPRTAPHASPRRAGWTGCGSTPWSAAPATSPPPTRPPSTPPS